MVGLQRWQTVERANTAARKEAKEMDPDVVHWITYVLWVRYMNIL